MRVIKRLTKLAVTGSMMIWLSGFVFLLCCATAGAQVEDAFCPLTKSAAHCDKSKSDGLDAAGRPRERQSVECCGFLPLVFDKVRKLDGHGTVVLASSDVLIRPDRTRLKLVSMVSPIFGYRAFTIPKNQTFLRNRTFRI